MVAYLTFLLYTDNVRSIYTYLTMVLTDSIFIGVDTTSGRKAYSYAALDGEMNVVALADAELDEFASFLDDHKSPVVAINAPSHVNKGLVRVKLEEQGQNPHQLRGVDLRLAEYELRDRGIAVSATSAREVSCPAWVQAGFELYKKLAGMGFSFYPDSQAPRQMLETHPHACYCALLGAIPLSKPTLEGRLQRELVLFEHGLRIKDPMTFFEEITRFKLLNGALPVELVHSPEELDALVAAYTAWVAMNKPSDLIQFGSRPEGLISLPVPALKDKY